MANPRSPRLPENLKDSRAEEFLVGTACQPSDPPYESLDREMEQDDGMIGQMTMAANTKVGPKERAHDTYLSRPVRVDTDDPLRQNNTPQMMAPSNDGTNRSLARNIAQNSYEPSAAPKRRASTRLLTAVDNKPTSAPAAMPQAVPPTTLCAKPKALPAGGAIASRHVLCR